jgi:hypothetical protein
MPTEFEKELSRSLGRLRGLALLIARDASSADDLLQESMVRALLRELAATHRHQPAFRDSRHQPGELFMLRGHVQQLGALGPGRRTIRQIAQASGDAAQSFGGLHAA